jgi:quercetin dioxygenase-like cupin family protein
VIKKYSLDDYTGGWVIGNFVPTLYRNENVEIAIKTFKKGTKEPSHKQRIATELTIVVEGKVMLGSITGLKNDIIEIPPGIYADFEAIEESVVVCIKFPSIPGDKVLE